MITVEYTAQLRRAAGLAFEKFDAPQGCTLQMLVDQLIERHGEEFQRVLLGEDRQLLRSVLVFVDDEQVLSPLQLNVQDGQTVTFAAPISGG